MDGRTERQTDRVGHRRDYESGMHQFAGLSHQP